jgi:enoyl-[acyl-carrier protein] reductase II
MKRGADFLGCEVAFMGGAMSWISERNLVSAISNAGGFGVIACGAMTPELLDTEIAETKKRTDRPFGVNLITMHPQLSELIDVCKRHEVGHVVLAGGLPPPGSIERIKEGGAKLICFAPALALAKKLIRSGVDALVIEGMEAGGHIGPVSTSVLAQEILPPLASEIPIFVAGRHRPRRAHRRLSRNGRVGVQLGTRFVCADECIAHPNFKKAFIRASARTRSRASRSTRASPSSRSARSRTGRWRISRPSSARSHCCSTGEASKWPRPSSRSNIIGPARSAAR